jgi:DNA-directed RNA polymerase subunit alpha
MSEPAIEIGKYTPTTLCVFVTAARSDGFYFADNPAGRGGADLSPLLLRPIGDLNLTARGRKCLRKLGVETLGDLVRRAPDDILRCRNTGVTTLNEIRKRLAEFGLKLAGD